MLRKLAFSAVVLTSILTVPAAFAWGNFGHQVVGELASRHLCPKTARAVSDLLAGESLSAAATWADEVRRVPEYKFTKPWHFVTMPLDSDYAHAPHAARGDLISGYHEQLLDLKNPAYAKRDEALRLIIHLVGDAHQPFHAGDHEDGGGNGVIITWFGFPSNLHKVWDTGMIKKLGLTVPAFADLLDKASLPAVAAETPEQWVTESSHIAAQVYPKSTDLGTAYETANIAIAKQRLREAGLRLAEVLNATFGCR